MSANDIAPIIIKRKKVAGGDGHHGGAWKVAYADFVTAMMAFFLLMWLLNATTEKQRKGIADYFSPTIPVNRISGGGDGSFGGEDIFSESTLARSGNGATQRNPSEKHMASGDSGVSDAEKETTPEAEDKQALESIEEKLSAKSGESLVSPEMARHILTRVTDEGLIVELYDLPGEPLFAPGTDVPSPIMTALTGVIAEVFALVRNDVAINGFTRARPIVLADNPVWDLSHDRADRIRLALARNGLPEEQVQRVSGFADRKPVASNPMAPRNNRIELILLRQEK